MTPRVSVVMPVRDGEGFVGAAIESMLGQTLADLELIVIDDGSRDATAEIVAAHTAADSRIRVHACRERGLVAALNEGCALATSDLIARMDADDVAEPHRLARQVETLARDHATVLLGAWVTQMDEAGRSISVVRYPESPGAELLDRNCFAHPTVVFRRDAFEQAGGYRSLFPHAEDYDLWLRLAEVGRVANLPEPLLRYRVHAGQVTRRQIEEQAAATLAAQAMTSARRATGVEPATKDLKVDEDIVRRRVLEAHVNLAALALAAGRLDEAGRLLDAAGPDPLVSRQRARLELRRRRPVSAAWLLVCSGVMTRGRRSGSV